ncbi:unnamed protein product [Trichobilharzia regenti]|nr:unnamed protein product [Trichobilharzia regenti]
MPTFSGEEENTTTAADVIILGYGEDEASDRVGQLRFGKLQREMKPDSLVFLFFSFSSTLHNRE